MVRISPESNNSGSSAASDVYKHQADFLKETIPHTNRQAVTCLITVTIPSSDGIQSSHTCNINLANIPDRQGHILPDLVHSLLSVGKFCDDNYEVKFTRTRCEVRRDDCIILQGHRDPVSRLWLMPLDSSTPQHQTGDAPSYGLSAYTSSSKSELVQFLHASAFSPVASTLLDAVGKNHFVTWPGLTTKAIRCHLPKSFATAQGHLDRQRQNFRTTQAPPAPSPE